MSLKKFNRIIEMSKFDISYERYIYFMSLKLLRYIPILREMMLYHVNVSLKPINFK